MTPEQAEHVLCAKEWLHRVHEAVDYVELFKLANESVTHVERLIAVAEATSREAEIEDTVSQLADLLARAVVERTAKSALETPIGPPRS